LIKYMIFIEDDSPGLHPPGDWQQFLYSKWYEKYPLNTTTGTSSVNSPNESVSTPG
jgi:hypothetical protein